MIDEQTRRDMLDNDIARADRIAKRTLGKNAKAYLHPYMGIVIQHVASNCALSSRHMALPDDELGRFITHQFDGLRKANGQL